METKTIKVPVKLELDIEVETVKKVTLKERSQENLMPKRRTRKVKRISRNSNARAEATAEIGILFQGRRQVRASEAYERLKAAGIASSTIARTKIDLGIKSRYENGCYWWVR